MRIIANHPADLVPTRFRTAWESKRGLRFVASRFLAMSQLVQNGQSRECGLETARQLRKVCMIRGGGAVKRVSEILIGIDGGGSGCRVAIALGDGTRLAEARSGPANFTSDPEESLRNVREALDAALRESGLDAQRAWTTARAHAGLAGVQTEGDVDAVRSALPLRHLRVTDDRPNAISGALGQRDGVLLALGTGTIFARQINGALRFVGGWGSRLSDHGSAAWLGRNLLERVLLSHEGLRPETDLTRDTFAAFGRDPNALVYFARDASAEAFAAHAPFVADAAESGDQTGLDLMRRGASFLLDALSLLDPEGLLPVCLSGGLGARYSSHLGEVMATRLVPPEGSALDGALRLAATTPKQSFVPQTARRAPHHNAIVAPLVFDGRHLHVGKAVLPGPGGCARIVDQRDLPTDIDIFRFDTGVLAPAFVDLQTNGGGGVLFNDATDLEGLRTMAAAHASLGTGGFLPTLITDEPDRTRKAIDAVASAIEEGIDGILGLHLEGPHLSRGRKGAHDAALIRPMTDADEHLLTDAVRRLPNLLVTLAPEAVPPERISRLAEAGVIVSLGHTEADPETIRNAIRSGARVVTHLYNAMAQLQGRDPGLVGETLANPGVSAGLIADGIHVDPVSIRAALSAKRGLGRVFLVTDAMSTLGSDVDRFSLNGREVRLVDGRLVLADGTLAGAHVSLPKSVGILVEKVGLDLAEALRMATSHPARILRNPLGRGHISDSARWRVIHLTDDWAARPVDFPDR